MQQARGMNNGSTLFGIHHLPTDNQIRNLLDPVKPDHLLPVFASSVQYLQDQRVVDQFRSFAGTLLMAMDATTYFVSESIHCPACTVAHHRDGRTTYSHSAVLPAIVSPTHPQVIPLEPEFVVPQDGHDKQDCETAAAKRWLEAHANRYSSLGVTVVADDLYASQPFIEKVLEYELQYIFVAKPTSHKYLTEELQAMEQLGQIRRVERLVWTGRQRQTFTYCYVNDVALKDAADSLTVNWVELVVTNADGSISFHNSFITSYLLSDENVVELVQAGRCRWKIENEDFNTLKTKGYHFEHNFGHGKHSLSQTLLSLNLIAFLFHTVLELLDERCLLVRKSLPRRDTFFQHIAALTQYLCFASWQSLLEFMLRAIREGPAPPPNPSQIIG